MAPARRGGGGRVAWDDYLTAFHTERRGITEAVLGEASAEDGCDPYDWVARALPGDGVIVDVACGSGPLATRFGHRWIGLDRNRSELGLAAQVAPGRVVLADATSAPLRAGRADAVVCSMSLMLFDDPGAAVAEMARLLRAGGVLVALVPATAPLTMRDRMRYARLLAALRRRRVPFRHHRLVDDPGPVFEAGGLTVASAERRRFAYPLSDPEHGVRWMRSLYLPGLAPRRLRAGLEVTRRWTGSSIGIPLRRLVAIKPR